MGAAYKKIKQSAFKTMFLKQCIKYTDSDSIGESTYFWCGWICLFLHPVYWFIWSKWAPDNYENTALRFLCSGSSIAIILRHYWPRNLRHYFYIYWNLFLILQLPMSITFFGLKNGLSTINLVTLALMAIVLSAVTPSLILFLCNFFLGIGIAYVLYFLSEGQHVVWDPIYLFYFLILITGLALTKIFSYTIKQQEIKNNQKIVKALAGSIAHEMRNPLAQVYGNLQLVQQQIPLLGIAKPIVAHHINSAQKVIQNALQVIDITMDAIREKPADPGNFQLLCAKALVKEAVADYAYEEIEHVSRLSIKGPGFELMGEAVIVKYIFYNLIQNALFQIKTLPNASIVITLIPDKTSNRIEVRDTGPGIAPDAIPRLFDSFYTSGNQGGTGLGLSYCKRSMKVLGGDIHCDSKLDQYTAFTLSFPRVSVQQEATGSQQEKQAYQGGDKKNLPQKATSLRGKSILIAEDDRYGRRLVKMTLEKQGVNCLEAENGQQALELLETQHCDLILSDMQMPLISGLELVQMVRKRQTGVNNLNVPIIVLTAEEDNMIIAALQLGACDYLTKPITSDKLIPKLHQWLSH